MNVPATSYILNSLSMIFEIFLGEHLVFRHGQFIELAVWPLRAHFLMHQLIHINYQENRQCNGLSASPPNSYIEALTLNVMVLKDGAIRK